MICRTCGEQVRLDLVSGQYFHVVSDEYHELETIAREVREIVPAGSSSEDVPFTAFQDTL